MEKYKRSSFRDLIAESSLFINWIPRSSRGMTLSVIAALVCVVLSQAAFAVDNEGDDLPWLKDKKTEAPAAAANPNPVTVTVTNPADANNAAPAAAQSQTAKPEDKAKTTDATKQAPAAAANDQKTGADAKNAAQPAAAVVTDIQKPAKISATINFTVGQVEIPAAGKAELDKIIKELQGKNSLRINIWSYADGGKDSAVSASEARRMSLKRAVSIRKAMIDAGIARDRINIKAMGDNTDGENKQKDRIEFEPIEG